MDRGRTKIEEMLAKLPKKKTEEWEGYTVSGLKIKIDKSKCTTPFDCKKCLQICPPSCFRVFPTKETLRPLKESDKKKPGTYFLEPFYLDQCTLCGDCVRVCPVGAIEITFRGQQIK